MKLDTPLERACIALIYGTKKLRHHLQAHTAYLISRLDPIKYIFEKLILSERVARWHAVLSEFDIQCVNPKSVKGRATSEALADGPISGDESDDDFPDENIFNINISKWKTYFDGASNRKGNGAGVLLIDPHGIHIPFAVKLSFPTTNNTAEYEACIYGIKAALAAGEKHLTVYGDSNLIISQTIGHGEFAMRDCKYALANLAVNLTWEENVKIQSVTIVENEFPVIEFENIIASLIQEDGEDPWYIDIKKFLINGQYPEGSHKKDQLAIRRLAAHFIMLKQQLYHKGFDRTPQLCIYGEKTQRVMEEVHGGECGPPMNGRMLARKILRAGYILGKITLNNPTF
ncbi:uncharacterized protein [Spinacia oleracea]|uniref:RNase H type-1 domain-containing protein n=1 Tax=Spinacia oleracea TaxID=3562 RepID=A0A9R0JDV2_SPIOL|nr:uncharacterized protein LOC110804831 [Spinacia oleracea]